MNKILPMLFALTLSLGVSANSSFSEVTIEKFTVHDYGEAIIIQLNTNASNTEGCSINNQMVLKRSHLFFDQMYSALLSAFHANTKFTGWVDACYQWGMPVLIRLDMTK